ncbi:hypothetical protein GGR55DRAFT_679038 [Xylaria sp. FL0064]|nr:hypothetical protein GGR55DRAFT_679038 [Xylaria sp. FL0064]
MAEMLSAGTKTPKAAIVCTPNGCHVSVGLELADAGVHLLVEKPKACFVTAPSRLSRRQGGGPIMINFLHEFKGSNQDAVEDGAALTLRFASGAVGTFILVDEAVSPHFFEAGTDEDPTLP